ncbi:putative YccA/Bax inhibitor family protein [Arcanobacterium wilhelmae]|uniref:YccA/Bax inhibitor family protein n=1 Tax=Arcanobacterium wilhelmae TaxID=1803177 RepID=A0ABT9NC05_9ACTO|nr:Bax inhibitor-1/YccA family protein [Arcanobacterium wilhelmae]MDP9801249.1 putative YccA/Bax inhibitor family protein [Arcanobacterium wilhelmae]WFN90596.1 Bax inhibitor-1/YccA family protein [Arcanobacterium wilhelmae]
MSNPIMQRNPYFQGASQNASQAQAGYQPGAGYDPRAGYAGQYGSPQAGADYAAAQGAYQAQFQPQVDGNAFEQAPAANRMTYQDAMNKTAAMLGATVAAGVATAFIVPLQFQMPLAIVAMIAAFVVGMVIAFKRMVGPGLALGYSVLEGVALGAITFGLDRVLPGVAFQAILGTLAVVGVTLGLHYSGAVRTTPKGRKIVLAVALAGLIFAVVNMLLMAFGVTTGAWGLRSVTVMGLPLGIILGVVMIVVASYMLIGDFEDVNTAIANGAPKEFAWTVGIAIVMTILWIYVEVLRLAAMLASDR